MKPFNQKVDFDIFKVILQKYKLNFKYTIDRNLLDHTNIYTYIDPICDQYLIELETYLAKLQESETIEETDEDIIENVNRKHETHNFPKTPWDFFKEKYFPNFLKKIFTVNYQIHTFECEVKTIIKKSHITKKCINKYCPHTSMKHKTECLEFFKKKEL